MIVRTYGRRSRCAERSFSDSILLDAGSEEDDPLSQEPGVSQPDPYGFAAFSSQDSSPWSLDSDLFGREDAAAGPSLPPLPPPAPRRPGELLDGTRKPPRDRKGAKGKTPELLSTGGPPPRLPEPPSSTVLTSLMETLEGGEMMEHVEEVNYALDGLRAGQPTRIRQACLLSLLTICTTSQRRRFLRAQGMSKKIIDAVLGLPIDDSTSSLAAAALFYVLTSDVPSGCLLESPSCICFLLKLLNPPPCGTVKDQAPSIGRRLSGLSNAITLNCINRREDSSSSLILSKIYEILLSCKELKPGNQDGDTTGRPELSSKWIALLTLEKACLSTVSIEDTTGRVSKVGGNFKEKLRELGGLDAIFNVASSCYLVMEGWLKCGFPSFKELKSIDLQSTVLLLKCFKIMENATFLSKDNQDHLLGMGTKTDCKELSLSFVGLVINVIRLLSGLSLHQKLPRVSMKNPNCLAKEDSNCTSSADSCGQYNIGSSSHAGRSSPCQKRPRLSPMEFEVSDSKTKMPCDMDISSLNARAEPHVRNSCNGKSVGSNGGLMNSKIPNITPARRPNGWISIKISKSKINSSSSAMNCSIEPFLNGNTGKFSMNCSGSKMSSVERKRHCGAVGPKNACVGNYHDPFTFDDVDINGSESVSLGGFNISKETRKKCAVGACDPFAFDEDELGPSKWEMLATRKETSEKSQSFNDLELENGSGLVHSGHIESMEDDNNDLVKICPVVPDEEPNLVEDCLLTAVKVLMNLTNDNPVGCQQIASRGGLDTLASLISIHFQSFNSFQPVHNLLDGSISVSTSSHVSGLQNNSRLSDHELDFLVAILGLLVNLVEKDTHNRSLLVSASVTMSHRGRPDDCCRDVISLLCSIFMANRGAGEVTGEGNLLGYDDEATLLQGEREAEMMIVEAYAALLLAFLSTESKVSREAIASCLPNHSLEVLVPVLERFVAFHVSLNMISPETHSIVKEVIGSCKGS